MVDYTIRPYQAGDEEGILETFNLVFREVCGEGYRDRDMAHWQWEFARNPQGMRVILAVTPAGRVAAQYAAVPMAAHTPLGRSSFVHAVDSMVHPDFRQGLKKPGLFVETGRAWFRHIAELGIDSVGFGYPVRPAWRIGNRFLGYSLVRVIDYLVAERESLPDRPAGVGGVEVERWERCPAGETDAFWQEWARGCQCAVIRDSRYLDWRYAECPSVDYVILAARRGGRLVGLAVLHPEHELVPSSLTFADWLLLPGEEEAGRALVEEARRLAAAGEREKLTIMLSPWCRDAAFFGELGFRSMPSKTYLERRLGSYLWGARMTSEWLAENWYYTLGDSDLV